MSKISYHKKTLTDHPRVFNNEWGMSDGYTWTWNNFSSWMQCFDPYGKRITDQLSGYQVRTHIDTASVIPPIYKDVSDEEVLEAHRETLLVNSMTKEERAAYYDEKSNIARAVRNEEERLAEIEYQKKVRRIRKYLDGYRSCIPETPTTDLKAYKAQGRSLSDWHKLALDYVKSLRFTTVKERHWWLRKLRFEYEDSLKRLTKHKKRVKESLDFYSLYLGKRILVEDMYGVLVGELEENGGFPLRLKADVGVRGIRVNLLRRVEVVDAHTSHSE